LSHSDSAFMTTFIVVMGLLAVIGLAAYFIANLVADSEDKMVDSEEWRETSDQNIKLVGQVNIAGEALVPETAAVAVADAGSAATADTEKAPEATSAESIYTTKCMACHAAGVAGAPKLGDTGAWGPRIAKGMETLVSNAINGLNAMPPKGTCTSCSDADIKMTVEYMVGQSQ
jgi:cytochrome c5